MHRFVMVERRLQKLSSSLWQLQQSGAFCDAVLVVAGNVEIPAHAAVLAAASTRLCSMMRQQDDAADTVNCGTCQYRVDVVDYDRSVVSAVLRLIYTGETTAITSLNSSCRSDAVALCTKLGITLADDDSADNCFHVDLSK